MTEIESIYPKDKKEMYALLKKQLAALTEGEGCSVANMANASALINGALENINWAGFYIMRDGELVLGPFQGKTACVRIALGRGVCGTAAQLKKTQLVPDVHAFPGHIACDCASRSEVVVPMVKDGRVVAVLDIDSPQAGRFDREDALGLEALAGLLTDACQW